MAGISRAFSVIGIVATASGAFAQVADIQPYYAVVTSEKAVLRCNDSERFYKVGELATGTVVQVDGEGQGWSRVVYPGGLSAFVRAEDLAPDGNGWKLSQPSKLKAANQTAGYDGSYKALFNTALPAGTAIQVIEPVKDASGAIAGYKIVPPSNAKGFVETRTLRRASDSEVAAFRAKTGAPELAAAKPTTAPATPKPTPATPATPTGTAPGATPANPTAAAPEPAPAKPTDLTDPMVTQPGTPNTAPAPAELTQKTDPNAKPADAPGTTPAAAPTTPTAPAPVSKPASAKDRLIATAEKLEATFRAVWRQPILTAEVDELIAEYDRALAATPSDRPNLRAALESRRQALDVRRNYRNTARRQEEERASLDKTRTQVDKTLEELAASRYYTIIGQLQPSLVYDGKQLPQMYRVVSVGGVTPRTLGYLKRTERYNLDTMIGQVVGVIGEAEMDRSLQLNIIAPVQVDVLKYSTAQPSFPAPDAPTAPPTDVGGGK